MDVMEDSGLGYEKGQIVYIRANNPERALVPVTVEGVDIALNKVCVVTPPMPQQMRLAVPFEQIIVDGIIVE